jgi:putative transposase
LTGNGIIFATRLKRNAKYEVIKSHEVNTKQSVISDETIKFTGLKILKKCPIKLRLVTYLDKKTNKKYEFLTNNFKLSAKIIADIYKSRWQVELFFKWTKQNLKIKKFIGTSKNAVMTQIQQISIVQKMPLSHLLLVEKTGYSQIYNPGQKPVLISIAL